MIGINHKEIRNYKNTQTYKKRHVCINFTTKDFFEEIMREDQLYLLKKIFSPVLVCSCFRQGFIEHVDKNRLVMYHSLGFVDRYECFSKFQLSITRKLSEQLHRI